MTLVDLDDLCEDKRSYDAIQLLDSLRKEIPTFCATLFTIPGLCSFEFIEWLKETRPWLDLCGHGWKHATNYEASKWTREECADVLKRTRLLGIHTRGWKAPGWQISDGCYRALGAEGYWCADQESNHERWRADLPVYHLGIQVFIRHGNVIPTKIHGHIGHLGGYNANALDLIYQDIIEAAKADTDFRFISEVMV